MITPAAHVEDAPVSTKVTEIIQALKETVRASASGLSLQEATTLKTEGLAVQQLFARVLAQIPSSKLFTK